MISILNSFLCERFVVYVVIVMLIVFLIVGKCLDG